MSITGFGIHCTLPEGEAGTLYVYTKEGNHYDDGAWHSPFMWNRVMRRTNFTCAGEGEKTYIYFQGELSAYRGICYSTIFLKCSNM